MQMKDTAAKGDGNRNLINQKLLLSVFKSMGAYSKYTIEMFVSMAQIKCLLTPRLSEQFKWPKKFQTDAVKVLSRGRDQTKL